MKPVTTGELINESDGEGRSDGQREQGKFQGSGFPWVYSESEGPPRRRGGKLPKESGLAASGGFGNAEFQMAICLLEEFSFPHATVS